MSELSPKTVAEIKAAVHEVIEEQRHNFWVEPEEHYLHHKFISDVRGMGKTVRKTSIMVVASTFVAWVIKMLFFK